jgi:zinc protease
MMTPAAAVAVAVAVAVALLGSLLVGGCAGSHAAAQKPPASGPSVVEIEYESVQKPPAPPPNLAAVPVGPDGMPTFWKNRTDLIKAPPPPVPAELRLPHVDRWLLKNGLEVVLVARHDLPVASFSIAIKAGAYDEEKGKTLGVADFTASMLRKGTKSRSADEIAGAIDFVGGQLETQASGESSAAGCSALSKDAHLCIDLLSDILLHPTFPEIEMGEQRDQVLAALAGRYDNPHELASEHFDNLLFGEKNPDGWVLMPEDVKKITRDDLVTFWKTYYRPNNAILAVAGDVDPARLRAELEKAFGAWEKAEVPARAEPKVPAVNATRILLVDRPDLTQATMTFGHPGIKHADPDWYAVTLMNYVLGGSDFSSRLMTEVRSRRGLTYGIGSSFGASLYQGAFRVSASTKNSSAWDALVASVAEIRRMKADGPSADEIAKAKGFYAGSYPFKLQGAGEIAGSIVAAELHGMDAAYVKDFPLREGAVDAPTAKAAAAKRLEPDALWVVIVGRAADIEPQLAKSRLPYERIDFKAPISFAARSRLRREQERQAHPVLPAPK